MGAKFTEMSETKAAKLCVEFITDSGGVATRDEIFAPDYFCCYKGVSFAMENKKMGGVTSRGQRLFEERWTRAGGLYVKPRHVGELIDWLDDKVELIKELEKIKRRFM